MFREEEQKRPDGILEMRIEQRCNSRRGTVECCDGDSDINYGFPSGRFIGTVSKPGYVNVLIDCQWWGSWFLESLVLVMCIQVLLDNRDESYKEVLQHFSFCYSHVRHASRPSPSSLPSYSEIVTVTDLQSSGSIEHRTMSFPKPT